MKLLEIQSDIQKIELYRDFEAGLVLLLDGMGQFSENVEYRYHECLCVMPMLFCNPRRVFVGGGGDGLAATRLLKFPQIEEIVVCDYDPDITRLAQEQKDLVELNENSLNDPRVRVINADAFEVMKDSDDQYDLIICDFPDPLFPELNRIYSLEFYRLIELRLSSDGIVVVQTLAIPACARIIGATLREALGYSRYYGFRKHGFTLASRRPLNRSHPVPSWTRFLSEEYAGTLFVLPKDEAQPFSVEESINRMDSQILVKEALVDAYRTKIAYPLHGQSDIWVVQLSFDTVQRFAPQLKLLLEALHEHKKLVLLVDEAVGEETEALVTRLGYVTKGQTVEHVHCLLTVHSVDSTRRLWDALSDGSVVSVEDVTCKPNEHAEIREQFDLANSRDVPWHFDLIDCAGELETRSQFVMTRDPSRGIVALFRIDDGLDGSSIELIDSRGGTPALQQSILLLALLVMRMGVDVMTFDSPDPCILDILEQLGGCDWTVYRIFLPTSMAHTDAEPAMSAEK